MNKIAVIGASGEVGYRLIQRLSGRYLVTAIVRDEKKRNFNEIVGVNVCIVEDIGDTKALAEALEECAIVINAAYIQFAEKIHMALRAVKDNNIEQVIFTGSTGIYTKLKSKSAQDKIDAEKYIKDRYPVPWTILRPTMIYGHADDRNFARLLKFIKKSAVVPIIGDGSALIQPVSIFDLVELMDRSILNRSVYNRAFDVAGADALSNYQAFRLCADLLGKKRVFVNIHYRLIQAAITLLGLVWRNPLSQEQALRFMEDKNVDISEMENRFAFAPRYFEEGLRQQVGDMRNDGYI